MPFLSGQTLTAYDLNLATRKVFARAARDSNTATTTTTELGVLRLNNVAMLGGRGYWISSSNFICDSTVVGDFMSVKIRYTIDGTTPGLSSPILAQTTGYCQGAAGQDCPDIRRYYAVGSNLTLSMLLTIVRVTGTGNVNLALANSNPIDMEIEDAGDDPGDTGVDL